VEAPVIDEELARRLIAGPFPEWAELPVTAVELGGVDTRTFRLGEDMDGAAAGRRVVRAAGLHRAAVAAAARAAASAADPRARREG
jgi:aminoglycoside phosphotransferase (APT) family kinase protein